VESEIAAPAGDVATGSAGSRDEVRPAAARPRGPRGSWWLVTVLAVGVALVAAKRSAIFGRAPSVYDVQFGLNLWGFLDDAPPELVASRRILFSSISHDYVAQRRLVDSIPDEMLPLSPEEARAQALGGAAAA